MVAPHRTNRGFTVIELMIVISIILILLGIAVPVYHQSILRAREAVLRQDLFSMRMSIDQYTADKLKAPQSLEEIVSAGYMREIPNDPFTNSRDTWVVVEDDTLMSPEQTAPGISDVHSGSELISTDGKPYSAW